MTPAAETGDDDTEEEGNGPGDRSRARVAIATRLARVRTTRRYRILGTLLGAAIGIGLTWIHWIGLIIAGAVIGIIQRNMARAAGASLGFGVLVLLVMVASSPDLSAGELLAFRPIVYVTVGSALGLPLVGSLARLF
ncbi:MAG: hypothetical protein ABEI52_01690 [Halobacteriaceae archaeon]